MSDPDSPARAVDAPDAGAAPAPCLFRAGCESDLADAQARVDALFARLTPAQLVWKPAPERWSVAECVDHLARTLAVHLPKLERALERGRRKGWTGGRAPFGRGTWFGRVFLGLVDPARENPKRLRALRRFRAPAAGLDPAAVGAAFRARNDRLRALVRASAGLDLGRIKVAPPPTNLVRLSLAQALQLHRWHHPRHLDQAERVVREPAFPSG